MATINVLEEDAKKIETIAKIAGLSTEEVISDYFGSIKFNIKDFIHEYLNPAERRDYRRIMEEE